MSDERLRYILSRLKWTGDQPSDNILILSHDECLVLRYELEAAERRLAELQAENARLKATKLRYQDRLEIIAGTDSGCDTCRTLVKMAQLTLKGGEK